MAAVIKILPYDPGKLTFQNKRDPDTNKHHPHQSPTFDSWFFLSIRHHSASQKNYSEKEQGLSSKAVAAFYLFLQVFVTCCVECVKRIATTTVHHWHLLHSVDLLLEKEEGEKSQLVESFKKSIESDCTEKRVKEQLVSRAVEDSEKLLSDRQPIFSDQQLSADCKKISHLFDFYYFRQTPLSKTCRESSIATIIFEVHNAGLTHLAKDVASELRNRYEFKNGVGGESGEILACCEIQWSVPIKYRSAYWPEMMIKNETDQLMRVNNQLIFDQLFADVLGLRRASRCGKVEEVTCSTNRCHLGVRRHFYQDLVDLVHPETKAQHESFWKFDPDTMALNVNWPVCGDFESTTVVVVNFICLKF